MYKIFIYSKQEKIRKNSEMDVQWIAIKTTQPRHCSRWGHSSCKIKNNDLIFFGGYADKKYFNDVWIFNNKTHEWKLLKIQNNQNVPSQRSNASLFYNSNYVLMFGGGSAQNTRYNDVWKLQIHNYTKDTLQEQYSGKWTQVNIQNDQQPWGRTYHIGELYQNYLIIHGGQGYGGQLDDIWALNLQNFQWKQLKCDNNSFPKGRRFHTSAIVKDKLYIMGGTSGDYNCLNQIYSFDLTRLKQEVGQFSQFSQLSDQKFSWTLQQPNYRDSFTLARWGHVSKVFEDKIYIFGGRTYMELNDLLVYDLEKNQIRKIQTCKNPAGRRKPCCWIVGGFFVVNSGYNGNYLDDQFAINLHYTTQINSLSNFYLQNIQHKKQNCDIHINTIDNKYVDMSTKYIQNSFQCTDDMINFMEELAEMNCETALKYINILNNGVFIQKKTNQNQRKIDSIQSIDLQEYVEQRQIDESLLKKYQITYSNNQLLANKKKILFNIIKECLTTNLNPFKCIKVAQAQFNRIIKNINKSYSYDLQIQTIDQKVLCESYVLSVRSNYFKNVLKRKEQTLKKDIKNQTQFFDTSNKVVIKLQVQAIYLKVLLIYCYYGHVILPTTFGLKNLMILYEMASKYAFKTVQSICLQEIKDQFLKKNSLNSFTQDQVLQALMVGLKNDDPRWQFIAQVVLSKIILGQQVCKTQQKLNRIDININILQNRVYKKQILKCCNRPSEQKQNQSQNQNKVNKNQINNKNKTEQIDTQFSKRKNNKAISFQTRVQQAFQQNQALMKIMAKLADLYKFQIIHKKKEVKIQSKSQKIIFSSALTSASILIPNSTSTSNI